MENDKICEHCGFPVSIRNPSGYCDHLQYPDYCDTCKDRIESEKEVVVTIDDAGMSRIDEIADELAELGMTVEQRLGAVGVITGQIKESSIDSLRQVKGVVSVELSKIMSV